MIRLHHCPETRSQRVLWLLHEIGCDFEVVTHDFGPALHGPAFRALHPASRVPLLEMEGTRIFESGAMLEWLCEAFPEAGLGRAPGLPERAAWLQWIHFAETISQHTAALTQSHVALREAWMRSPTVMKIETRRLARCYAVLEAALEGRDHLLAGGFSAADIAVGQAVAMGRHFVTLEAHPALALWWERITARPGWRAALPREGEARLYDRAFYDLPPEAAP